MDHQHKIGLSLSGGGIRGMAHLGVLKAMEAHNMSPNIISGTSSGAIIAALYASGNTLDDMFELLSGVKVFNAANFSFKLRGAMKMKGIESILNKHCKDHFDKLNIPLFVATTNLNLGKIEYISEGEELIQYVIASASVPGIYNPIEINGTKYVDGGVIDNLPTYPIRKLCKHLIGVNVNPIEPVDGLNNIFQVVNRAMKVAVRSNIEGSRYCDLFLEPERLSDFNFLDNSQAKKVFDMGYESAESKLSDYIKNNKDLA